MGRRKITPLELKESLRLHKMWLDGTGGKRFYFFSADLTGADLSDADLRDAEMYNCNLSGADLSNANLSGAELSGTATNLSGAKLCGSICIKTNFAWANFDRADLSNANLSGANLNPISMENTIMHNANLSGTVLCWAKLKSADLTGVIVDNTTNLYRADLSDAKYDIHTLHKAILENAIMSDGTIYTG